MGRYSKILLGPARKNDPQVSEAEADVAIMPGTFVVRGAGAAASRFILATAAAAGRAFLAQENYLMLRNVDTPYRAPAGAVRGDLVVALELEDDVLYAARIATGQNVTAIGTALAIGAAGNLVIAGAGAKVVAFSDEIFNNNTGSAALIRIRPAGSQARVNGA